MTDLLDVWPGKFVQNENILSWGPGGVWGQTMERGRGYEAFNTFLSFSPWPFSFLKLCCNKSSIQLVLADELGEIWMYTNSCFSTSFIEIVWNNYKPAVWSCPFKAWFPHLWHKDPVWIVIKTHEIMHIKMLGAMPY